jgi:tetratricopeptide (TPR) repeat protein
MPAQAAVRDAVSKIALAAAGGPFRRLLTRVWGSRDERARRLALATAVAAALRSGSDLDAIGLATALRKEPFAGLITRVLQDPHGEVDRAAVERAFAASVYDLEPIGIDPTALVEEIRGRFLEALRTGPTLESKHLYLATRAEQNHSVLNRLELGQERITGQIQALSSLPASPLGGEEITKNTRWKARIEEAQALQRRGAVRSALRLWERLREEMVSDAADPMLRARIYNNIGAAWIELSDPERAAEALQQAVEYAPYRGDFIANLAQAELLADRRLDAIRDAERAIAVEPESPVGWVVKIQAIIGALKEEEIPAGLRRDPQILMARAMSEANRDSEIAIQLLREALRTGPRDPQVLILLGELLYSSMFPRRVSEPVPEQTVLEIARLGREAAEALDGTERSRLFARALVIQGAAADLAPEADGGAALFQRAMEVDPTYERARFAAAQAEVLRGDGGTALFILDRVQSNDQSASWHALRARALLVADRASELDADVKAAMDKVETAESVAVGQSLAETVVKADRLDLLHPVLELLSRAGQQDFLHIFRARAAVRQGDRISAERDYRAALEAVAPDARGDLEVEFASVLYGYGEYARAIELFETSGIWLADERSVQMYARSLFVLGRYEQLMAVLDDFNTAVELPDWALDLHSQVALERDDVPNALALLARLVELRPDDVGVRIRFAATLLRSGDKPRARETITPLEKREDLEREDTVNLAQLLIEVGRPGPALIRAYRALRKYPDDPAVQVACVAHVFFRAEGAGAAPAELFVRDEIVPDTWVKLRSADGEEVEYLILAKGPSDIRHHELLASDSRASVFLGLKKEDVVRLPPGAADEKDFVVVELKSALLHAFHDAMLGYATRFPGRTDLQMIKVGEGDAFNPWPFYRIILQTKEGTRVALDLYREKRLPVGTLATGQRRSLRRTYLESLYDPGLPIPVEEPSAERLEDSLAEARKHTVVLTATGLATLQELNLLDLLPKLYHRLIAPQSLVDELYEEIAAWKEAWAHGGYHTADVADEHKFTLHQVTPGAIGQVKNKVTALRDFVLAAAEVMPRPLEAAPGGPEEARELLGASSYDAYMLAGDEVSLHADDWGLRNLARFERNVAGFSTYALLRVAHERGLLCEDDLRSHVIRLITLGHTFLPIDVALLYQAIAEQGFQMEVPVLRVLDVLADSVVTIDSAVGVAVGTIRELALSPFGAGAISALTTLALDRLAEGRSTNEVILLFIRQVDVAFRLLPHQRAIVRERIDAFVSTR